MDDQKRISKVAEKTFPGSKIVSTEKFTKGLVSLVYKLEISNPDKVLVVKFFPKKNEDSVVRAVKISNYLRENSIPSPEVYDIETGDERFVVMGCLPGVTAYEVWNDKSSTDQLEIIHNAGTMLKRIHNLQAPDFWIHSKHEVASPEEWVEWTKSRIKKYFNIAEEKLDGSLVDFLKLKFSRLEELYESHPDFRFVPMHWDFHLANINIDSENQICGVLDFDNVMKGHDMADLGQTIYWLLFQKNLSDIEVEELFTGYGNVSETDKEFARLHAILFLVGVMRSRWLKNDPSQNWINELHIKILRRCASGEILFPDLLK